MGYAQAVGEFFEESVQGEPDIVDYMILGTVVLLSPILAPGYWFGRFMLRATNGDIDE